MSETRLTAAWNAMVMNAEDEVHSPDDERRASALACLYMAGANNGGLNAFLTNSWSLDAQAVLGALRTIGAGAAADQLHAVLDRLGAPLPAMTQDERWDRLEMLWTDDMDEMDVLTEAADDSLLAALQAHVAQHAGYYAPESP